MMERAARGFLGMMGKATRGLLSLALVLCMCVPSAAVLALGGGAGQAGAVEDKEKVTIVHPGTYYRYSDGGYSGYGTAKMYVANLDAQAAPLPVGLGRGLLRVQRLRRRGVPDRPGGQRVRLHPGRLGRLPGERR